MSSQRRTIMGACDYSIATLQQLRKDLMDIDLENKEVIWAIGGIVTALTSNLLQTCHDVMTESTESGESDIRTDLIEIQSRVNAFIDRMITHE